MKDNLLKSLIKAVYLRPGSVRRIASGPMRGMLFRVNKITGLSPWYSGVEREHQKMFKKLVGRGDVVIDIGANWGAHTLYLSRLAGEDGLVIAVEPFKPAFAELQWHAAVNKCGNVRFCDFAVSDRNDKAFFIAGSSAGTGRIAGDRPGLAQKPHPEDTVDTRTLDSVIEEFKIRDLKLVKIDIEGTEGRALAGARKTIERFHPYFIIDLHSPEQDVFVAKILIDSGYSIERLGGPPILHTTKGWPDRHGVWGSILAFRHGISP